MALPIPNDIAAMQLAVAFNQAEVDSLTITQSYTNKNAFLCMLDCIGCEYKERFRLLHDGFNTIKTLVDHFQGNMEEVKKHLTNSNKTWMNNTVIRMRAFYSPVLINKLVGVVYYFQTSVNILHTIPNINAITPKTAASYASAYSNSLLDDDQDDEASKIELPTLIKAKDWTPFKETFLHLLSITHGAHKIPLTCH